MSTPLEMLEDLESRFLLNKQNNDCVLFKISTLDDGVELFSLI